MSWLIRKYLGKYKKEIILALVFTLGNSFMTVFCSKLLKYVVSSTIKGEGDHIVVMILLALFLAGAWSAVVYGYGLITGKLSIHIARGIRQDTAEKIMGLSYSSLREESRGNLLNRLVDDISETARFFEQFLFSFLLNGISILVILFYLFTMNWRLVLISMIWIPFVTLVFRVFLNNIAQLTREKKKRRDRLTAILQESFESYETEKSYNLQQWNLDKEKQAIENILEVDLKEQSKESTITAFSALIQSLPSLSSSLFAAYMAVKGTLSVGDFIAFVVILNFISQPIGNFSKVLIDLRRTGTSVRRLERLMKMPDERKKGEEVKRREHVPVIEFSSIGFSYQDSEKILKHISFQVKRGEKIAFAGNSGSGKSTLFSLILGLYEAEEGEYRLYGTPFSSLDLGQARSCFSIVSQETFVFPDTIEENLRYGNPLATREEIKNAVKAVGLDSFIEGLPRGYDTVLEEGGANLSGGQKQRLSIARALLRNSDILLFDEPTSSLDSQSESEIVSLIDEVMGSKTIITIAHKLDTISEYDRIYFIADGTIVEQGTHEQLLSIRGHYYKMVSGRIGERQGA